MSPVAGAWARFKEYEQRSRAEPPQIRPEDLPGLRAGTAQVVAWGDITPEIAAWCIAKWEASAAAYARAADAGEDL